MFRLIFLAHVLFAWSIQLLPEEFAYRKQSVHLRLNKVLEPPALFLGTVPTEVAVA